MYQWELLGLYLLYYVILPLGFIVILWKIREKRDAVEGLINFGSEGKRDAELKKRVGEMEKLQVFIVIFFLLFIPVSNLVSSQIQELSIEYDQKPVGGLGGSIEYRQLRRQLGPSYDTDSVISEMESAPSYGSWYIEDVREEIDLDRLTRLPGSLAVYYLDKSEAGEFMVITYSYLSPVPITRYFVFFVFEDEASLFKEDTLVYPENPAKIDPF